MPPFRSFGAMGRGLALCAAASLCLCSAQAEPAPRHKKPDAGNAAKPQSSKLQPSKPAPAKPEPPKPAPPAPEAAKPPEPKAPPHFASLKRDKVNLRTGPSEDYPIEWVFVRKGLPVEVVATYDIWRKVRDSDGTLGWVNQQMLSDRRSVLVMGTVRSLVRDPRPESEIVAQVEPGVVAALSKCDPSWCQVKAAGYQGWLPRDAVWGVAPGEVFP